MLLSAMAPVVALTTTYVTSARAMPVLEVKTIAEDDQVQKTGIIVFGITPPATVPMPDDKPVSPGVDKLAQYKLLVTLNGVPVTSTIYCQVIEKDKVHPLKNPQFAQETVKTKVVDVSADFVCKVRTGKQGVSVLDVYYLGPQTKEYIADYELIVAAQLKVGSTTIWGTDLQDICALGWAMSTNHLSITKPDGTHHDTWDNPLGPFVSCEEAAMWQRSVLFPGGVGIGTD